MMNDNHEKKKKRSLFGEHGSVTVLVTLILIPVILIETFMVDLARIKLYGNQAIMAADNYGETVLSLYDNLLKDLYGLFAVTQDQETLEQLDALQTYVSSSFDPNRKPITFEHFQFEDEPYKGFMPYEDAEITLKHEYCPTSTLSNTPIMLTQIGDFMRFRVGQALFEDGGAILDALEQVKKKAKDSKVIDKKSDLDKTAGDALDAVRAYYYILKDFKNYVHAYLNDVGHARAAAYQKFDEIVGSPSYLLYVEYQENLPAVTAALEHQKKIQQAEEEEKKQEEKKKNDNKASDNGTSDGKAPPQPAKPKDELTEEEKRMLELKARYDADPEAKSKALKKRFTDAINAFEASLDHKPIDFESYDQKVDHAVTLANQVQQQYVKMQGKRASLEEAMKDPDVSDSLKTGIKEELAAFDKLFDANGTMSASNYTGSAKILKQEKEHNTQMRAEANQNIAALNALMKAYMNRTEKPKNGPKISSGDYDSIFQYPKYKELYELLQKTFEDGKDEAADNAKKQKSEAEKKQKEAEEALNKQEKTSARSIPENINIGNSGKSGELGLMKLIKTAASIFEANNFQDGANRMLLKFYTAVYDFNMFSCRTTNKEIPSLKDGDGSKSETSGKTDGKKAEEKAVSLTGYELSRKINYLYMAELEYIFGGFKDSQSNLNDARNKILAFRAVVNFSATYSIAEINSAIRAISSAATAVNPILGIAVAAALRMSVTALETAQDWAVLSQGDSVVVLKNSLYDLTAADTIMGLLGKENKQKGESTAMKLDYEQYLMVMIVFMTTTADVAGRTGDLITLNVNTVRQNIGESGTLEKLVFEMKNAYTALNATCSVKLGFAVLPMNWARKTLEPDTMALLEKNGKNGYSFTVTRGY